MPPNRRMSVVQYIGENASTCGYCHSQEDTSVSSGLYCHSLHVEQYQQLLDRGWRRSGCYLYKPNMQRTCCPQYTIRLDVNKFSANKAQKRVLRKWDRFLAGGSTSGIRGTAEDVQADTHPQQGSCDTRQKRSHGTPAKEGTDEPTASLSGQHTTSAAQHHILQSHTEGKHHKEECFMQQALRETLEQCMHSQQFPQLSNLPQVRVFRPAPKLAKRLPVGVQLTTPAPQVLAGTYRKALGTAAPTADALAGIIMSAMNDRCTQPEWVAAHGSWAATALKGHINFHTCSAPAVATAHAQQGGLTAMHQGSVTGGANHVQGPSPLPKSSSTAAVAEQTNTEQSEPASRPARDEEDKVAVGNGPTSSVVKTWTDPVATYSLQQAIADQPASSLAQPIALGEGDPANQRPSEAAHQPAASAGTGQTDAKTAADRGSSGASPSARGQGSGGHSQDRRHHRRHLEIRMVPAGPELIDVEYPLYHKYQVTNHHDKPSKLSKKQFQRFLIDSPFPWTPSEDYPAGKCPPRGMGTFHQQYWLDGKLIAVGVLDVLPSCLSSVYLFWDNDYAALSPGKFSALKEAEWVQEAARHCPALHHYYMGFYIHSCHKMQYKADYQPSDLLCPERLCWVPFDRVKAALDEQEYQVLSDLPGAVEGLGPEHKLTLSMQQHWQQCRLRDAKVAPDVVAHTLVFWQDAMSVYSLVQFKGLADLGAPQALQDVLEGQLQECHCLAGSAAAQMAFVP